MNERITGLILKHLGGVTFASYGHDGDLTCNLSLIVKRDGYDSDHVTICRNAKTAEEAFNLCWEAARANALVGGLSILGADHADAVS